MKTLNLQGLAITSENQDIVYNGSDTLQTMALKEHFDGGLLPSWAQYTARYSEKMLGPIMTMMRRGILIDIDERDRIVALLKARHAALVTTFDTVCLALFDTDFNINSPNQLKLLFYTFLAIPEQTKSKKGESKVSTDREVLERIVENFPRGIFLAKAILRIRDLEGQIEFLTRGLSPEGRFHCSYNLAGTETFRLSSNEHPLRMGGNAQNLPKSARTVFKADEGYTFCQADQQGAEARVVAYLSGDKNYIDAVEGGDSHTMVASMVFGFEPIRELAERPYYRDYTYRDLTKKGAHGSNYYGKPYTLAKQMKVETSVAEQFQRLYFKKFPGISDWHAAVAKQLQEVGHITTPWGIRRTFWGRRWDDATLREAIAFVPQSFVGILTNVALYKLWHRYEGKPGAPLQLLANGHDAAIFQVRTNLLDSILPEVLELLRISVPITDIKGTTREVVIPWDIEVGLNWGKHSDKNPNGLQKWKPSNV